MVLRLIAPLQRVGRLLLLGDFLVELVANVAINSQTAAAIRKMIVPLLAGFVVTFLAV